MIFRCNSRYLRILASVVSASLAPILSFAASIDEVRMWRAPDHTRLVFDLSEEVSYNLFTLDNPHRVVVDIKKLNTTW